MITTFTPLQDDVAQRYNTLLQLAFRLLADPIPYFARAAIEQFLVNQVATSDLIAVVVNTSNPGVLRASTWSMLRDVWGVDHVTRLKLLQAATEASQDADAEVALQAMEVMENILADSILSDQEADANALSTLEATKVSGRTERVKRRARSIQSYLEALRKGGTGPASEVSETPGSSL